MHAKWDHFLELAPDLAVEVVSPSDRSDGVQQKICEYLDANVKIVWIVHPVRRTVMVYAADRTARVPYDDGTLDGGDVLPRFTLAVADIFNLTRSQITPTPLPVLVPGEGWRDGRSLALRRFLTRLGGEDATDACRADADGACGCRSRGATGRLRERAAHDARGGVVRRARMAA